MQHSRSIGRYISIIYRQAQCYINRKLEAFGIGSGQFIFLNILYQQDGIRQEEISYLLDIDKGTTARAIKKLEEEGYVYRKIDSNDRRAQLVFLTDRALSIKGDIFKILRNWTDILVDGFSEEDKQKSINLLEAMTKNIHQYYNREEK
ncbi:MAG: MarR family transcriptional regulator [Epulopiscium sp.]|nr:MarR family transcriptional regulator [Candidatus Epulonipiscium sp.]